MQSSISTSQRTCVGCRKPAERDALLRFTLAGDPGEPRPDRARRAPGRGASLHPNRRCLEAAVRNGGLRRGLGGECAPDLERLARAAAADYGREAERLLERARRARQLCCGEQAVRAAIAARSDALLIVARDAAGAPDAVRDAALRLGANCLVYWESGRLARLLGGEAVGVAAVTDPRIAGELQRAARHAQELLPEAS